MKLIVANWKMNPKNLREAKKLYTTVRGTAGKLRKTKTVICPPYVFIVALSGLSRGSRLVFGGQDLHWERDGSFTGEISAPQLSSVKAQYVIIGHSERREMGETNEMVNKKVHAALKEGLIPIVCIGEHERDQHAEYLSFLRTQIQESLARVSAPQLKKVIIAYEPIWAVGAESKGADSPEDVQETVLYIRKILAENWNKKTALALPVLYGGSVDEKNTRALLAEAGVQGLLVGRASLNAKQFNAILKTAEAA